VKLTVWAPTRLSRSYARPSRTAASTVTGKELAPEAASQCSEWITSRLLEACCLGALTGVPLVTNGPAPETKTAATEAATPARRRKCNQ
jgi:hypothetical protein